MYQIPHSLALCLSCVVPGFLACRQSGIFQGQVRELKLLKQQGELLFLKRAG